MVDFKDLKEKFLASLPTWQDFIFPSRYARKLGIIASWGHLVALILAIVCSASGSWLVQYYEEQIEAGRAGTANITTWGYFGLARYTINRKITALNGTVYWAGEGGAVSKLADIGSLAGLSAVSLAFVIIAICLNPISAGFTFYHSWARGRPRVMYIVAICLSGLITLLALMAFLVCHLIVPHAACCLCSSRRFACLNSCMLVECRKKVAIKWVGDSGWLLLSVWSTWPSSS